MGDHQAGVGSPDGALKPEDAFEVQVIGWLVEKQHVRRGYQRRRDGEPLPPSAGERRGRRSESLEAGPPEDHLFASCLLPLLKRQARQRRGEHGADGIVQPEHRILGDVGDLGQLSQRPHAGAGRLAAGEDLQ